MLVLHSGGMHIENRRKTSLILGPDDTVGSVGEDRCHWQKPHTSICPEYLYKIFISPDIIDIGTYIGVALALEVIQGWRVFEDQFYMELKEENNCYKEDDFEDDCCYSEDKGDWEGDGVVEKSDDLFDEERDFDRHGEDEGQDDIEEE